MSEVTENKSNTKILLLTHGQLGKEMIKSAEMIVGETENIFTVGLIPQDDPSTYEENIITILDEEEENLVILTDIFNGTTSNVAISLLRRFDAYILTGLSLGILLEASLLMTSMNKKELVDHLLEMRCLGCRMMTRETFGLA